MGNPLLRLPAVLVAGCLTLALSTAPILAQNPTEPSARPAGGSNSGSAHLGFQHSVGDDETAVLTVEPGARFDLDWAWTPGGLAGGWLDVVDVDIEDLGDPLYESFQVRLAGTGRFDLTVGRTQSDFLDRDLATRPRQPTLFDDGTQEPTDPEVEAVQDAAGLRFRVTPRATLFAEAEETTRGDALARPLESRRSVYDLDRPLDESSQAVRFGFSYDWERASLTVLQRNTELGLDDEDDGGVPAMSPADTVETRADVELAPHDRWRLRLTGGLLETETETFSFAGTSTLEGETRYGEAESLYRPVEELALIVGGTHRLREQEGFATVEGIPGSGLWDVTTSTAEAGLQWSPMDGLDVGAKALWHRWELAGPFDRDTASVPTRTEERDTVAVHAIAGWQVDDRFHLTGELDTTPYVDPYTLRTPEDRTRYRIQAAADLPSAWRLTGSLSGYDTSDDDTGFERSTRQAEVRLAYDLPDLQTSVGYGLLEIDNSSTAPSDPFPFPTPSSGVTVETAQWDSRVHWQPSERYVLDLGILYYENTGDTGFDRLDLRMEAEYRWASWSVRFGLWDLGLSSPSQGREQLSVLNLGLGYHW